MPVPAEIERLVEQFDRFRRDYRDARKFNETQARRELIDPFFVALGWDVDHRKGGPLREVVHEDKITIQGKPKAPDYSFRLDNKRKFFVEAKKPSVDIEGDVSPALQVRRYAWTAKLARSVLTDFEEFSVYDTTVRPSKDDKPAVARVSYTTFTDYPAKWDEIAALFSREAVLAGSLDSLPAVKRAEPVDAAFLGEIERWRDLLARNFANRNPGLSERELNFAVQQTIDRIIFLRIAEDRGVEPYGQLGDIATGAGNYDRLVALFRRADGRYNSGLFHFAPEKGRDGHDSLTPALALDDRALKDILRNLYEPLSPYEFSVFPPEVLGQVYEQFLGKVIRLTGGHRAVVEEKPEVRKAGGVYYTPAYIVDYIVRQTVGKLVEGHSPDPKGPVSRLRVLDPACGSGSFLLGAFQYLLDWHLEGYRKNPDKWLKGKGATLHQTADGELHLSLDERKRILLDNLYGVDIDAQAVEVTKLSLLLKVLEGTPAALGGQLSLFAERVLPDLERNIKCGNSLIGPDFYAQGSLFSEKDVARVNAFDWKAEFKDIMNAGGFDAVIGNPPYVRQESLTDLKPYFQKTFESYQGTADLYVYFIEQGIRLVKEGGFYSIIVSSSFLHTTFARSLRKFIPQQISIIKIVDFGGLPVFESAKDTYVCIPVFAKIQQPESIPVIKARVLGNLDPEPSSERDRFLVPRTRFQDNVWSLKPEGEIRILNKLHGRGVKLGEYVGDSFFRGVTTGYNGAFVIDRETKDRLIDEHPGSVEIIKPLLGGQDIRRYFIEATEQYLIFARRGLNIENYPAIKQHLLRFKSALTPKPESHKGTWIGRKPGSYRWFEIQDTVDYYRVFEGPKIIYPDIAKGPRFFLDVNGTYLANTAYCLGVNDPYLLGILNSKLFWFVIGNISIPFGTRAGQFRYRLIYQYMEQVPIRTIDFSDAADAARHGQMVELVERMLELHRRLAGASIPADRKVIERQIEATDKAIDALVYELYGLTEEEIAIVEGTG